MCNKNNACGTFGTYDSNNVMVKSMSHLVTFANTCDDSTTIDFDYSTSTQVTVTSLERLWDSPRC